MYSLKVEHLDKGVYTVRSILDRYSAHDRSPVCTSVSAEAFSATNQRSPGSLVSWAGSLILL